MRLIIFLFTASLALFACQETDGGSGGDNGSGGASSGVDGGSGNPNSGTDSDTSKTVELDFYSYDIGEVTPTDAAVGDTVVLDLSNYSYDQSESYNWVAWTGKDYQSRVWNSNAFGDIDRSQPRMEFTLPFPGHYTVSWCPTNAVLPCVLHGELSVTGELVDNSEPEVDFYYADDTVIRRICSSGCLSFVAPQQTLKLIPDITDDDTDHTFSWTGRSSGENDPIATNYFFTEDELEYTPTKEGRYRFEIKTFDGYITAAGLRWTQNVWSFIAREPDNGMPQASFTMEGFPGVAASMVFKYDTEHELYYPAINYFYENTLSLDDCNLAYCSRDDLHFDEYVNNRGNTDVPSISLGESVRFNASNSSDPEGAPLSYIWSGFIDRPTPHSGLFLQKGQDQVTFEFTPQYVGDYYVALCVQEADALTLYSYGGGGGLTWPYDAYPSQRCPQIQFKVVP